MKIPEESLLVPVISILPSVVVISVPKFILAPVPPFAVPFRVIVPLVELRVPSSILIPWAIIALVPVLVPVKVILPAPESSEVILARLIPSTWSLVPVISIEPPLVLILPPLIRTPSSIILVPVILIEPPLVLILMPLVSTLPWPLLSASPIKVKPPPLVVISPLTPILLLACAVREAPGVVKLTASVNIILFVACNIILPDIASNCAGVTFQGSPKGVSPNKILPPFGPSVPSAMETSILVGSNKIIPSFPDIELTLATPSKLKFSFPEISTKPPSPKLAVAVIFPLKTVLRSLQIIPLPPSPFNSLLILISVLLST